MHEGHRKRMFEKINKDPGIIEPHELLETLLFYAIPRKNTNFIAHDLIDQFGSLAGVFSATHAQLKTVNGIGDAAASFLVTVGEIYRRLPKTEDEPPVLFNSNTFGSYLIESMRGLKKEVIRIYCLGAHDAIKFTKEIAEGEADRATAFATCITELIATQHPNAIVVAHNHPASCGVPSHEDDVFTAKIQMICSMNGVKFYDHMIGGTDGSYSYFRAGRMEQFRALYSVDSVIEGKGHGTL